MREPEKCMVAGCKSAAPFGFAWAGKAMHTCLEHREAGDKWLAKAKGEHQPGQGVPQ